ncbi:hypothetical protein HanIR_Chr04g0200521 [Helianthus annuus]|nr:hypothetical protein HanIR_Chr04g0200521 [Helianthus annuus]
MDEDNYLLKFLGMEEYVKSGEVKQYIPNMDAVLAARIMNATLVLPEFDMNSYSHDDRCFDIFTPHEEKILMKYRKENFADKKLVYSERRAIRKRPLTPAEVP